MTKQSNGGKKHKHIWRYIMGKNERICEAPFLPYKGCGKREVIDYSNLMKTKTSHTVKGKDTMVKEREIDIEKKIKKINRDIKKLIRQKENAEFMIYKLTGFYP